MPTCPSGHTSASDDYCDVCGALISGAPAPPAGDAAPAPPGPPSPGEGERCPDCDTPSTGRFCEVCGYDFVKRAAHNPVLGMTPTYAPGPQPAAPASPSAAPPASAPSRPAPPPAGGTAGAGMTAGTGTGTGTSTWIAPGTWLAIVTADRDYFDGVQAEGGPDAGGIQFPPYCPERRFPLAGTQIRIGRRSASRGFTPEIDLTGPPEDPGVSHMHALLLARPDGGWTLVDPGSTNGTTVNYAPEPVEVNAQIPLTEGDRIHVGAWTTIRLYYHRRGDRGTPPAADGVSEGVRPQ